MRAAAGDGVSPSNEEAARQLEERQLEGQMGRARQGSSLTARRHESPLAAGPAGSSSGSGSSSSGGARGQAAWVDAPISSHHGMSLLGDSRRDPITSYHSHPYSPWGSRGTMERA
jgi:hypothetical protein